jgi:RNA polymerase sigma factor (TIGR02999 family)
MADPHITTLIIEWRGGDQKARDELFALVYKELRIMAQHYLRLERPGHTLQPTALVHELYLRLVASEPVMWQDRAHFFAVAAQALRRILVDSARARHAGKRGGNQLKVSLTSANGWVDPRDEDLLSLHQALVRLAELEPRAARVVELRFFGGLSESEVAEVLHISTITVKRDWRVARAWLMTHLSPLDPPGRPITRR